MKSETIEKLRKIISEYPSITERNELLHDLDYIIDFKNKKQLNTIISQCNDFLHDDSMTCADFLLMQYGFAPNTTKEEVTEAFEQRKKIILKIINTSSYADVVSNYRVILCQLEEDYQLIMNQFENGREEVNSNNPTIQQRKEEIFNEFNSFVDNVYGKSQEQPSDSVENITEEENLVEHDYLEPVEFIPGTKIPKPRYRGVYESDEHYVAFLAEYYARFEIPNTNTFEKVSWDERLTDDQILDAYEKGIYKPEGPEYQKYLAELGLSNNEELNENIKSELLKQILPEKPKDTLGKKLNLVKDIVGAYFSRLNLSLSSLRQLFNIALGGKLDLTDDERQDFISYYSRINKRVKIASNRLFNTPIRSNNITISVNINKEDNDLFAKLTPVMVVTDEEKRRKYANYGFDDEGKPMFDDSWKLSLADLTPLQLDEALDEFVVGVSESISDVSDRALRSANIEVNIDGKKYIMPYEDFGTNVYKIIKTNDKEIVQPENIEEDKRANKLIKTLKNIKKAGKRQTIDNTSDKEDNIELTADNYQEIFNPYRRRDSRINETVSQNASNVVENQDRLNSSITNFEQQVEEFRNREPIKTSSEDEIVDLEQQIVKPEDKEYVQPDDINQEFFDHPSLERYEENEEDELEDIDLSTIKDRVVDNPDGPILTDEELRKSFVHSEGGKVIAGVPSLIYDNPYEKYLNPDVEEEKSAVDILDEEKRKYYAEKDKEESQDIHEIHAPEETTSEEVIEHVKTDSKVEKTAQQVSDELSKEKEEELSEVSTDELSIEEELKNTTSEDFEIDIPNYNEDNEEEKRYTYRVVGKRVPTLTKGAIAGAVVGGVLLIFGFASVNLPTQLAAGALFGLSGASEIISVLRDAAIKHKLKRIAKKHDAKVFFGDDIQIRNLDGSIIKDQEKIESIQADINEKFNYDTINQIEEDQELDEKPLITLNNLKHIFASKNLVQFPNEDGNRINRNEYFVTKKEEEEYNQLAGGKPEYNYRSYELESDKEAEENLVEVTSPKKEENERRDLPHSYTPSVERTISEEIKARKKLINNLREHGLVIDPDKNEIIEDVDGLVINLSPEKIELLQEILSDSDFIEECGEYMYSQSKGGICTVTYDDDGFEIPDEQVIAVYYNPNKEYEEIQKKFSR